MLLNALRWKLAKRRGIPLFPIESASKASRCRSPCQLTSSRSLQHSAALWSRRGYRLGARCNLISETRGGPVDQSRFEPLSEVSDEADAFSKPSAISVSVSIYAVEKPTMRHLIKQARCCPFFPINQSLPFFHQRRFRVLIDHRIYFVSIEGHVVKTPRKQSTFLLFEER